MNPLFTKREREGRGGGAFLVEIAAVLQLVSILGDTVASVMKKAMPLFPFFLVASRKKNKNKKDFKNYLGSFTSLR